MRLFLKRLSTSEKQNRKVPKNRMAFSYRLHVRKMERYGYIPAFRKDNEVKNN